MLAGCLGLHWISVLSYSKAKFLRKDQDQTANDQWATSGHCKTETNMFLTPMSFYHLSTCWTCPESSFSRIKPTRRGASFRWLWVPCSGWRTRVWSVETGFQDCSPVELKEVWGTWVASSLETAQSLSDIYWVLLSDHRWQDNIIFFQCLANNIHSF